MAPGYKRWTKKRSSKTTETTDETKLYPRPAPTYDEEYSSGIDKGYKDDYSRLGKAWVDPKEDHHGTYVPHMDDEDGSGWNIPGEGKSRSRWRPFIALVAVMVMVAVVFAAATYGLETWGGKTVPNVVHRTESRARSILEKAGFNVEVHTAISDDSVGLVLEQDPEKGERVEEGSTVVITVAVGRTIPDVMGLSQQEAEDLLHKAGAQNVQIEVQNAAEEAGTVLRVTPEVGHTFSASDQITLTVSQTPLVPDIIGKDKVEAEAALKEAGFSLEAAYKKSDAPVNKAFETEPEIGSEAPYGSTVKVFFSEQMPSNPLHLLEYFGKSSEGLAEYLPEQGFVLSSGHYNDSGAVEAAYSSEGAGTLRFCSRPFSRSFDWDASTGEDVLASGASFQGIRWEIPSSMMPSNASDLSEAAVRDIMNRCELPSVKGGCNQSSVKVPDGVKKSNATFTCVYGEANNCTWTVLLVNESSGTRGVVTVAPTSYYRDTYDLSAFGDSICDMVACTDVYMDR